MNQHTHTHHPIKGQSQSYLSPHLYEFDHLQRLFNIGDLLAQTRRPSLCVDLHELVLGDHLLERAQCGLNVCARGNVVCYIVDEGCHGDAPGVCLGVYRAGDVSLMAQTWEK